MVLGLLGCDARRISELQAGVSTKADVRGPGRPTNSSCELAQQLLGWFGNAAATANDLPRLTLVTLALKSRRLYALVSCTVFTYNVLRMVMILAS